MSELSSAFRRSVDEGEERLNRDLRSLLATGAVGGIDVSMGVFAMFLVEEETHNHLLGGLAFSIGFIALTMASSELFTESFLVPFAAVVARRATAMSVLRLWVGTAVTNLAAGWVLMAVVMAARPSLKATAIRLAVHYTGLGIGREAFAAAVLGGTVITLMTWMERGTDSMPAKIVAAVSAAFLLGAGSLVHAIVVSLVMFAALHAGAPFGYLDWLGMLGWATLGNAVGGLGLVTGLRLLQVGGGRVDDERGARVDADADPATGSRVAVDDPRAADGARAG